LIDQVLVPELLKRLSFDPFINIRAAYLKSGVIDYFINLQS